ncbi:MAG: lysophospholipase [Planctomycetes bacterium]|jgi:alpha-beta hydrolase superfamily lysophospholipase|nr:lysophospholipase [Planctomycetota bacterium]HJO26917.1 alpha/beta hydrolase [Planctomycetota bacterium]
MTATTTTRARTNAPAQFLRHWPLDVPRARLVLVHGFGEHSGRYGHVAAALNAAGVAVSACDLRGHGESGGTRVFIERFDDYLDDVDAVLAETRAKSSGEPLFLLGHSMGGQIAALHALRRKPDIAGLILSSPSMGFAVHVPAWKAAAGRFFSRFVPKLTLPSGLDRGLLSHDPEVQRDLDADPLAELGATARWYTECLAAQEATFVSAPDLSVPLLSLVSGTDEITDAAATRRFHEAAGSRDKTWIEYPGLYHEIFNEFEREKVLADLTDWLADQLTRQGE